MIAGWLFPLTLGASMNVHSIVGHRAASYFGGIANSTAGISPGTAQALDTLIRDHQESVLAGSDFPDFLYACGSYADHHDAGEAAHWPPFHAAAVLYLRQLQPDPLKWDRDQRALAAFIFGLVVHYVTDELWEGLTEQLGSKRGFTELVDAFNLGNDGHGNVAEGVSNFGGDFYAAWALDESNISAWSRRFPLEHMVNIYHMTPKDGVFRPTSTNFSDVTLASLAECQGLFDLGLWALQSFGPLLYRLYNDGPLHQLPFITDHLFEAPLVGIDDMAATTTFGWARLARWLSSAKGPPLTPPKRSERQRWAKASADDADDRSTHALLQALKPFVTAAAGGGLQAIPPKAVQRWFALTSSPGAAKGDEATLEFTGPEELRGALFGTLHALSVHFLGRDAADALTLLRKAAIHSPPPPPTLAPPPPRTSPPWVGDEHVGLFGSSIAAGDFDADGLHDVVATAPGAGARGSGPRSGTASVRYGRGGSTATLRAGGPLARFGSACQVLDFNLDGIDDLAVSAPGASRWNLSDASATPFPDDADATYRSHGAVFVYLGAPEVGLSESRRITISASQAFTWLGATLDVGDVDADGHVDLLLGCPMALDYSGRVVAISSDRSRTAGQTLDIDAGEGATALDVRGVGAGFAGWLGAAVAQVGRTLLVGAPYARLVANCTKGCEVVGRVYGFDLDTVRTHSVVNLSMAHFSIIGTFPLGRLGAALATTLELVALGAPGTSSGTSLPRAGEVALVSKETIRQLRGDVPYDSLTSRARVAGLEAHARLGHAIRWSKSGALVVSGPFYCGGHEAQRRELGQVFVWSYSALPGGDNATTASATWRAAGHESRGRFGSALAVWEDRTQAFTLFLAIGVPRASNAAVGEQSGQVEMLRFPTP
jgi:hypothetical protein